MKKAIALILALVMVMSFAACGGETKTEEPKAETAAAQQSAENSTESGESAGLTEPVKLTLAAQEVGTGAYSVAAAIQGVMLKGLPDGSSIDLTTNSPGGVGAPVLIQNEECDLIVANAGPSQWSYVNTPDEYQFGGCTDVCALGGGLGHAFTNIMFT